MATPFIFKQFSLYQEKAAFKLGTDSVLLGAWVPERNYKRIIDLGAGTGILSLMMAQRFLEAEIWALEIDPDSAGDCGHNFEASPWKNRLHIINDDIVNWGNENEQEKFDLIITNPPYFINSLKNPDERKSTARHSDIFNGDQLKDFATKHLDGNGRLSLILPVNEFEILSALLLQIGLHITNKCSVSSFEHSEMIRVMGLFSFAEKKIEEEEVYLYNADHTRSDWYKKISADFYIK